MDEASDNDFLNETLHKNSSKHYNLEFKVFQTNHVAHGIIALHQLGASKKKILTWVEGYLAKGIEPSTGDVPTSPIHFYPDAPYIDKSYDDIIGARIHFGPTLLHYKSRLEDCGGSIDKLLHEEFPKLIQGVGAHLQHPIIQLGYGVHAGNNQIALEGLAYLHTSFFKPELSEPELARPFTGGKDDIFVILNDVRNHKQLRKDIEDAAKNGESWRDQGSFGATQRFIFAERSALVNSFLDRLRLPTEANGSCPNVRVLMDFMLATMIRVFAATEPRNDFVILHCVTGAWALREVIGKVQDQRLALIGARVMFFTLIFSYLRQGCHELHQEYLSQEDLPSWEDLVRQTLEAPGQQDEHFYKMVQVCREFATQSPENDGVCRVAAEIVNQNPEFHFGF